MAFKTTSKGGKEEWLIYSKILLNASFIFIVIRVAAPLVYASLSSYVASLAGIPNIAIEGVMNFAALFGVYSVQLPGLHGLVY